MLHEVKVLRLGRSELVDSSRVVQACETGLAELKGLERKKEG